MDPNATLALLRDLAEETLAGEPSNDAAQLAELFQALDGWISKGGFLPADWERAQQLAKAARP